MSSLNKPFTLLILLLLLPLAEVRAAAAIASAHPLATRAGMAVLADGGNAFDAAVAVTAVLAVVEPASSGLCGGGFWLLHRQDDQRDIMIDGRETAPQAATATMYLDSRGDVVKGASINGPLAAGIPGTVAAIDHIARHYGRLPLSRSLQPAIRIAHAGFPVGEHFRRLASFRQQVLIQQGAARTFLVEGDVPDKGQLVRQPDLARTLTVIANDGARAFYDGAIAEELVRSVRQAGGIWRLDDLRRYRVVERPPSKGNYHGLTITSASPPSSGGVAIVEMLNILSQYPGINDLDSPASVHLVTEAMRRAYRDRAAYLGDPDFVTIPTRRLLSHDYAAGLSQSIRADKATPSDLLAPAVTAMEAPNTSHFSIIDAKGNRVSATLSINYPFGSGFIAGSTGVLLNDEMDDFSAKPGSPNVYGLVGSTANRIEPGKRPLSSMSPTFIEDSRGIVVLGTPGGSRIITMVLLAILDYSLGGRPETMVAVPRFHHQYLPDRISYENDALAAPVVARLEQMGHRLKARRHYGNMHIVMQEKESGRLTAASDPRGEGLALVIGEGR